MSQHIFGGDAYRVDEWVLTSNRNVATMGIATQNTKERGKIMATITWGATTGRGKELQGVNYMRLTKSYISFSDEIMAKLDEVFGGSDYKVQFGVDTERGTVHIKPHSEYGNKVSRANGINKVQAPGRIEWLKSLGVQEGTYIGEWNEKEGMFDLRLKGQDILNKAEDAKSEAAAVAEDEPGESEDDSTTNANRSRSRGKAAS